MSPILFDKIFILLFISTILIFAYLMYSSAKESKKESKAAKEQGCICKWHTFYITMNPGCPYPPHKKFTDYWGADFKLGQRVRSIHPIANWPPDKSGTIERVIYNGEESLFSYDIMLYDMPPDLSNLKTREDALRLLGPYRSQKHEIWGGAPSLVLLEVKEEDLCLEKSHSVAKRVGISLPFFKSAVQNVGRRIKK